MIMRDMVGVQSFLLPQQAAAAVDPSGATLLEQRHLHDLLLETSHGSGRLPPQWEQCLDLRSGMMFFKNRSTGETSNSDPRLRSANNVEFEFMGNNDDDRDVDDDDNFNGIHPPQHSNHSPHRSAGGVDLRAPGQQVDLDLRLSSGAGSSADPSTAGTSPSSSSSSNSSSNVSDSCNIYNGTTIVNSDGHAVDIDPNHINNYRPHYYNVRALELAMNSSNDSPAAADHHTYAKPPPFLSTHSAADHPNNKGFGATNVTPAQSNASYSWSRRFGLSYSPNLSFSVAIASDNRRNNHQIHNTASAAADNDQLFAALAPCQQINPHYVANSPTATTTSTISSSTSAIGVNSRWSSPDHSVMSFQQPSISTSTAVMGAESSNRDGIMICASDASYEGCRGLEMEAAACMRCLMYVLLEARNGHPKCPQCGCPAMRLNYTTE